MRRARKGVTMENIIIMLIVVAPILMGAILVVAAPVYLIRVFAVKIPRQRRWVEAHNGTLIGSEEFYKICERDGIDPKYFI